MRSLRVSFVAAWLIAASTLTAANWPGFRGPNSSGVGAAEALPLEFGPEKNVVWKTELPLGEVVAGADGEAHLLDGLDGGQPFDVGAGSPERRVALEESDAAQT